MPPKTARKAPAAPQWASICRRRFVRALGQAAECFPLGGQSPEQIHATRRFLKQSRALALLLTGVAGDPASRALGELDELRRRTGDLRDEFVMRGVLAALAPQLERDFCDDLGQRIGRHATGMIGLTASVAVESRDALAGLAREAAAWPMGPAAEHGVAAGVRRSYKAGRRKGRIAFADRDDEAVHRWRKSVVDFRYQLDCLEQAWPGLFSAWIDEAEHLRRRLGKHHDLSVLAAFAATEYADAEAWRPLAKLIARRQASALAKAKASYHRLFSQKPRTFERQVVAALEHPKVEGSRRLGERRATVARDTGDKPIVH